ncbi:PIG-L deacetylase family protein [Micromonospora sp. DT178]|uniref:PIG-L deacetylase family protein n=1 Tax=Micromonospora sp. DT178 TaxID=3393436 RepID=UPI003CF43336
MSFPASAPVLSDVVRALAVFAHPDDVDFGCAGTIATWVDEGVDVSYLLVTRGDSGECAEVGAWRPGCGTQLTATADAAGLPAGRMAEAFTVLRTG